MAKPTVLPPLPVAPQQLLSLLQKNEHTDPAKLFVPFREYDAKVRELYAQEPELLGDDHCNVVSIFDGPGLKTRSREVAPEQSTDCDCYIMALKESRRPTGSPATVANLKEFKHNFNVFTELALSDMDWSNVVVAGSAALTPLLPVPEKSKESKRALRQYYHEELAPASDVDLFLYGLSEEQAKDKIKQIEARVRDSILEEVTCIRTKNAITIASQYPTRHVQIVLRVYKDVSEILTGFDVDCSCVAYDGEKVWAAPRAIQALMTQCNRIDLSRRSPSYENRLSKYSRRGFEIYFSDLDRSRIDPTIFERSFMRTVGLARLLVLEKLPSSTERDQYANLRRKERGRPELNLWRRNMHKLKGNIKGDYEDEISDWFTEDVSDYHTFTIPYGPKFTAKRIEKLLYTKDLLLNAEWNKPKDREVNLHRHPAFFGSADDVFRDCCEHCPIPVTDEEIEAAEVEDKIYVKGEISLLKDDPGRQSIGSFNPITDTDWTEMAYIGNTARLCEAIVQEDLDYVRTWLAQEDADPNQRDHTGRTPLQLAVLCSTPEIVKALIGADARLIARLANGYTALHLAAERGDIEIIRAILERSERNEAEYEERESTRRDERKKTREANPSTTNVDQTGQTESDESDGETEESIETDEDEDDDWNSEPDSTSMATESFVKVKTGVTEKVDALADDETDEPDFYDVNITSWDSACSPLHLAILNGHVDAVKVLVDTFGADVLLPVKLLNDYDKSPRAAILTLVLALVLPQDRAHHMAKTLLDLGASSRQADLNGITALQYYVSNGPDSLNFMLENDKPSAAAALKHIAVSKNTWSPSTNSSLLTAIANSDTISALRILENGIEPDIPFSIWIKEAKNTFEDHAKNRLSNDPDHAMNLYRRSVEQPIVVAVGNDAPDLALVLLEAGANPNSLPKTSAEILSGSYSYRAGLSLLDIVRIKLEKLRKYDGEPQEENGLPLPLKRDDEYMDGIPAGTYKHWIATAKLQRAKDQYEQDLKRYNERKAQSPKGVQEKSDAVRKALQDFMELETALLKHGAKTFKDLHPNVGSQDAPQDTAYRYQYRDTKKPFDMIFQFQIGELDENLRTRYLQLYEATWAGDLQTIKDLTLKPSGDEPPLKIAVYDDMLASPLSIAVLQGHLSIAEAILEICLAQWSPEKKSDNIRYTMEQNGEYSDSDDSYDSDSGNEDVRVLTKVVDRNFTIENVGEVSLQVDSHTTPLDYLGWTGPSEILISEKLKSPMDSPGLLGYAIATDNEQLLKWLLKLGHQYSTMKTESGITPVGTFYNVDTGHLRSAIKFGRTTMMNELIRQCGCGIPFEDLVKRSGIKEIEKPRYYQGLSVYGKKRADWAAAGRRNQTFKKSSGSSISPLLIASKTGALESLEYLLSDTPVRLYHEFVLANGEDKRVKRLMLADGGIERAITNWYHANEEFLISSVVVGKPGADADRRLEYLIKTLPLHVDGQSKSGESPLQLAFKLGRPSAAKILLAAGADRNLRDKAANNLIHKALESFSAGNEDHKVEKLIGLLELLGSDTVRTFLQQRNSAASGGGSPLHNWVNTSATNHNRWSYSDASQENSENGMEDSTVTLVRAILSLSSGKELCLINGSGDTILHTTISARQIKLVRVLLEHSPELLYRENATGRTPFELAQHLYTSVVLKNPPDVGTPHQSSYLFGYNNNDVKTVTDRNPDTFVREKGKKVSDEEKIWDMCREIASKHPSTRRLVTLNEANEVARRVGDMAAVSKRDARRARMIARGYIVSDDETEEEKNVVADWLNDGIAWQS